MATYKFSKILTLFIVMAFFLTLAVIETQAQIYTYPGLQTGCLCYGPDIDLEECQNVMAKFGLIGLRVQAYLPWTDGECGADGGLKFPKVIYGQQIGHCCAQHDLDWSTCNVDRAKADQAIGDCIRASACNNLSGGRYHRCMLLANGYQNAVSNSLFGHAAFRASQSRMCFCSPCGMP